MTIPRDLLCVCVCVCVFFLISIARATRLTNEKTSTFSEEETHERILQCRDPMKQGCVGGGGWEGGVFSF